MGLLNGWAQKRAVAKAARNELRAQQQRERVKRQQDLERERLEAELTREETHFSRAWVDRWQQAAQGLARIGDSRSVPVLVKAGLKDFNDPQLESLNRQNMAEAIRSIEPDLNQTIELLVSVFRDDDVASGPASCWLEDSYGGGKGPQARGTASSLLQESAKGLDASEGERVAAALIEILNHENASPELRLWVVPTLGIIGGRAAYEFLRADLEGDLFSDLPPGWVERAALVRVCIGAQGRNHSGISDGVDVKGAYRLLVGFSLARVPMLENLGFLLTRGDQRGVETLRRAAETLRVLLTQHASEMGFEDLRMLASLEDTTEDQVTSVYRDSGTDEVSSIGYQKVVVIDRSQVRYLAREEGFRRRESAESSGTEVESRG